MSDLDKIVHAAMQAPPPQPVAVLHPFNDQQLVAMMAAHIHRAGRNTDESVRDAIDILADTIVQFAAQAPQRAVQEAQRRHQARAVTL